METLKTKIEKEIANLKVNNYGQFEGTIYVDQSSHYLVIDDETFVYLSDHLGINDYIDEDHKLTEGCKVEGVGYEGVYWENMDFESPFYIEDIEKTVSTINV
jgi:hypothetical protein